MTKLARIRKTLVALLGTAATVAATIPPDTPLWRTAQIILAVATIVGVYQVRNAQPVTREALKEQTRGPRTGNPYADPPPPRQSRVGRTKPPPPRG
jgi:hypothetical protein